MSLELYLLMRLEKKKKTIYVWMLAFCLFLESTVVRGFYSANKDGRIKFLQPVRERYTWHLYLNLARVKKDLEDTDLQTLMSCCQACNSIVVHGNQKEIPPMPAAGAHQVFLHSCGL